MSLVMVRSRWARIGVGGACLAAAVGFAAGPAMGALAGDAQPPPGTEVPKTTDYVPGEQPPNPNPEPPTGRTTQVAPDEPGAAHPGPSIDRGDPNASSRPE
jgi:hypothetical protein